MEFGAEFFVLIGFIVFLCLLGYVGAHRMVLGSLDKRGKAIADELEQAAKLRVEATALLESFETTQARGRGQRRGDRRRSARPGRSARQGSGRANERFRRPAHQARRKRRSRSPNRRPPPKCAPPPPTYAAKAAEIVLRQETQGAAGAELAAREIAALKDRLN